MISTPIWENNEGTAFFFFLVGRTVFFFNIYLAELGLICGIYVLVCWPGIKLRPLALGAQSLSHWATGEVPEPSWIIRNGENVHKDWYGVAS